VERIIYSMDRQSWIFNFLELLKKQWWLIPILIVILLMLFGALIYLSGVTGITPPVYQRF